MAHLLALKKMFRDMLLLISGVCLLLVTGCTENIDESNFAIKKDMTAADYVGSESRFSHIESILKQVRLGNSEGASSLFSMLSARGNYTLFLPTNEALAIFLDENNLTSVTELSEEQLDMIAKNCIIDHGDDAVYEVSDFPLVGSFPTPNLQDRLLTCEFTEDSEYVINGNSRLVDEDILVSNGVVHVVDRVIAPSVLTLNKIIEKTPNLRIFSTLLNKTTWADSLNKHNDLSYDKPDRPSTIHAGGYLRHVVNRRYWGYTAFVEPDSIFQIKWNIRPEIDEAGQLTNWDEIYPIIKSHCEAVYGSEEADNLSHPDNAINCFVAYHLIAAKVSYNRLVQHWSEFGYKFGDHLRPQLINCPINVWDYYTTMGKHRGLLKVVQVGDAGFEHDLEHKMYLNRISKYADGPNDDYRELGVVDGNYGVELRASNGCYDNNALNGFYYPLNDILLYTDQLRNEMSHHRMRIDFNTIIPELITNNIRGTKHSAFDNGYFDNITKETSETQLLYTKAGIGGWWCYQGDYFMLSGIYDCVIKLPPVPKDGTYEIRMAVVHNSSRGMCQIYFGDNPDALLPVGLPYDMRQYIGPESVDIPWRPDTDNIEVNMENDKNLRNQGFLKAPRYYCMSNGQGDTPLRLNSMGARRIITAAHMEADKTYYLRYKSALKKRDSQCQLDYLEFAHTSVFNGINAEDVW